MEFEKRKGLADGIPGDSLFSRPIIDFVRENELPALFKKTEQLHDDRLLAIVTAMIVEERVDKLLLHLLPKYSLLSENSDFTFSMKLHLLDAFRIIPKEIIKAAHLLRKIRNEFAHNLNSINLNQINNKVLGDIKNYRQRIYRNRENAEQSQKADNDISIAFNQLSFYCVLGLDIYLPNIQRFVSIAYSKQFADSIYNSSEVEQKLITETVQKLKQGEYARVGNTMIYKKTDSEASLFRITEQHQSV